MKDKHKWREAVRSMPDGSYLWQLGKVCVMPAQIDPMLSCRLFVMSSGVVTCWYCRDRPGITRDHILPKSKGGRAVDMCCGSCNHAKKAMSLSEFIYHCEMKKSMQKGSISILDARIRYSMMLIDMTTLMSNTTCCMVCGKDFQGEEPKMCCSRRECGCMGMPIEPVVCSDECYDKLMSRNSR